jgi:ADP-ribose pyrophosphatase YjhB (NUDIX family)
MGRVDYYHDPNAPRANSLVPGASAIVVNHEGRILLHRRSDNARWALPGGVMDIGESIAQTVTREVQEETGLEVEPEYIVGVYSDPGHVLPTTTVRSVSSSLSASPAGSSVARSGPARSPPRWRSSPLDMHESIRLRIRHYLERHPQAVIA